MPLNNVERAKIFLGDATDAVPLDISEPPSIYQNFEEVLSQAHALVQGKSICFPEVDVCPGQLALYKAAQTLSTEEVTLPARIQNAANMLGLAANDSPEDESRIADFESIYHFHSGGCYLPETRDPETKSISGSADQMARVLIDLLNINNSDLTRHVEALFWSFSDRISNARHSYNGSEQSGWWYNGGFLIERADCYELYCASSNIGDTFGKAWGKDPNTAEKRNPLLDDAIKDEAARFYGQQCSDDLGAKIGYMMAPTNNIARLFHSIIDFSEAVNATTQTTLVSGLGQLSMNVSPGKYDAFETETDLFSGNNHSHLLLRLRAPIFSAHDFSSFKLGGTLVGIKAVWAKN